MASISIDTASERTMIDTSEVVLRPTNKIMSTH